MTNHSQNDRPETEFSLVEENGSTKIDGSQFEPFIGGVDEIVHEYHADNPYVLKGYRVHFVTIPRILKSLFMIHNESFNAWSHLLGFFTAIILFIITYVTITDFRLLYEGEIETGTDSLKLNFDNAENMTNPDLIEAGRKASFSIPSGKQLSSEQ